MKTKNMGSTTVDELKCAKENVSMPFLSVKLCFFLSVKLELVGGAHATNYHH